MARRIAQMAGRGRATRAVQAAAPRAPGGASPEAPAAPPEILEPAKARARELEGQGDHAGALAAWNEVHALQPDDLDAHRRLAKLVGAAPPETLGAVGLAVAGREPANLELLHRIRRRLADGGEGEAEAALLERMLAIGAADFSLRVRLVQLNVETGRTDHAQLLVEAWVAEADPERAEDWRRLARLRRTLDDADAEIGALLKAAALDAWDEDSLKRAFQLLQTLGRTEQARAVGRRLKQLQARRLRERLGEELDALKGRNAPPPVAPQVLDWAWSLADQAAWDPEAWRAAAGWGHQARELMRNWWLLGGEQTREIMAYIDPPDLTALREALAGGTGCVLAGGHFGPTGAAVQFFQACGLPFRTLGAAGRDQWDPEGDGTLIPIREDPLPALREAMRSVKAGTMIGLMADAPSIRDALEVQVNGRTVALSGFTPKLVWKLKVPSFWCAPLWRDDRIVIELDPLPSPEPGETFEPWARRWRLAYLVRLEAVMRGDPRNLGLGAGVWRNAAPDGARPGRLARKRPSTDDGA